MPPISSSRLAPRTSCNSSAASIWLSQVRRSCLGALRKSLVEMSAGRFMDMAFLGLGAVERPPCDSAYEVAAILRAIVEILGRVDGCGSRVRRRIEGLCTGLLARERRFRLRYPARQGFGAARTHTRLRDD